MSLKFACDRCGKRFASVDDPRPGRVYRIRCRCGNVVVLRPPAAATRVDASPPAARAGRASRAAKDLERHAPPSRPRPPPIPPRAPTDVAAPAASRAETPVEALEPIGELTPRPEAGGEREPTFEPLPAPEPPAPAARVEPVPAPPQVPPGHVEATPEAEAPPAPAADAPRVDGTSMVEPIARPVAPSPAVEPTPPAPAADEPAAGYPTPVILDDPFARAAAEEAARAASETPAPGEGLPLAARPDDAEETSVELSRSENLALSGLGNLFRGVVDAPALGGPSRRRWIAIAAGVLAAAAVAALVVLRR